MTNHALLDNVTHADLRVNTVYERGHGFDVNSTRVFPVEFSQLQMDYPLFFIKSAESGHFEAIALFGFSDGENLYLKDGRWDAAYIPLTVARQPFLIGFQEQDHDGVPKTVPVVHIDLDHPSVSRTEGEPVFLEHGGEGPLLERATSILMAIHEGYEASESLSKLLVGLELIESVELKIEFNDGSKQNVSGLYTINEDKLRALSADGLEALHEKGHLQTVYMMLASMPNVARLIKKKNVTLGYLE
ncbi:MAG: SapC family protein [Woeseiaceae bacterium]|nr:SapC family protein [Woeseiaceae bacterium]